MLKDFADFYLDSIFPVLAISLLSIGSCICIVSIFITVKEIKEIDKKKLEEKICLKK